MKNIEYSTFYKFMVSLGLALLVLAFAGPWLLLREPFPLLTKSSELKLLTPRAQSVIDERQRLAERSIVVIPWASSILFILGLGVTTVGVTRWSNRQKVLDEKENLENERLRREVRELPAEEAEERIVEEAKGRLMPRPDTQRSWASVVPRRGNGTSRPLPACSPWSDVRSTT